MSSSKEPTGYKRESLSGSVHLKFTEKEALSCFGTLFFLFQNNYLKVNCAREHHWPSQPPGP